MPEGHKTHFLAGEHSGSFVGQALKVSSPQGRFTAEAKKVNGRVLESARAVGKHLFYEFEGERFVHVHLGRYGSFAIQDSPPAEPKGQVRMRWIGNHQTLDLRGPTTCRVIDRPTVDEVCAKLGPDPLAGGKQLAGGKKTDVLSKISSSGKPIGGLLLDQSIVAGIGNIFRAEILFEIGLNPTMPGNELSKSQLDAIWKSTLKMMRVSLKHGRIISVTAKEAGKPLAKLTEKERVRVYGKQECGQCGGTIATDEVASRKMHWCPTCQTR